jgi:hypothetical protein
MITSFASDWGLKRLLKGFFIQTASLRAATATFSSGRMVDNGNTGAGTTKTVLKTGFLQRGVKTT